MAGTGIYQHRIRCRHDTIAYRWIAPIFKVQISADIVHNDKILVDSHIQMCDWIMKSHGMKMPFFFIRNQAFHIFQRTGHLCLAVSF